MARYSEVRNAEALKRMIEERNFPILVSVRGRKIYERGGSWHWKNDHLLNCDPERKIDVEHFRDIMGIKPYETPYISYGLANKAKELGIDIRQHGDTFMIVKREVA